MNSKSMQLPCSHLNLRNYYTPEINEINEEKCSLEKKVDSCVNELEEIDEFLSSYDDIPEVVSELVESKYLDLWLNYEELTSEIDELEYKLKVIHEEIDEIFESAKKDNCICMENE